MKILAVSDKEDIKLQDFILTHPDTVKKIDFIISCGDLSKDYLEFVVDTVRKYFFFVEGNHPTLNKAPVKDYFKKIVEQIYDNEQQFSLGGINIHARMEVYGEYILVGFEGSMRYNMKGYQYTEKEMAKIVSKVSRKIRFQQLKDFIFRRKKKKIIVVSHAPIEGIHDKTDICHKGFKCFKKFLNKFNPLIWFHGHVHFEGQTNEQISKINNTTIINVYGFHIIDIQDNNVVVTSNIRNFA
ncbi:MAG: metallophosphoesterase [Elusimicrobia bacterium]|jgi:Icc-related predicted phosphoesterase|nr:metallophosphoesterase [Elusimicrobiota bacterium]